MIELIALTLMTADPDWALRGRIEGYTGVYPFYVAVLSSRDLADPDNPIEWGTVDIETGKFDIRLRGTVEKFYLLGQLDVERGGPRLDGDELLFLKKLPVLRSDVDGKRMIFYLEGLEMAHVMRGSSSAGAWWIALGLALLLYAIGYFWWRRLEGGPRGPPETIPRGGAALWVIALGSTAALLPRLGVEALELLEFTYLHEGLRPASVVSLLVDQISAELSHPPLWPLLLRTLGSISRKEWVLRLPSVLAHLAMVLVVYRLVARQGRAAGLVAAAIAALAPIGFYYGRDATPYATLLLLSAGTAVCAVEGRWSTFAALLIVGFFMHYTVAVLGLALGLAIVWQGEPARLKRALVAFGVVIALPMLWSVHFIRTFLASGMSTRMMAIDYLPDPGFVDYAAHFGAVVLGWPLPAALVLVVFGAVVAVRRWGLVGRIAAVQLTLVVAYILFVHAMYMSFAGGRVFYAYRWSSVFLPGVAVCYAAAVVALWRWRRVAGVLTAAFVLGGAVYQNARVLIDPQRPDQWGASEVVRSQKAEGDAFAALPAVYYGQLFNYALFDREPEDLLAWPRWSEGLYGPFHPNNTTVETLSRNLAFERIWVAAYDERMFGTAKFDRATSTHTIEWMRRELIAEGEWTFAHLKLYRFRVPEDAEPVWAEGVFKLDFSDKIQNFRYFPELLHSRQNSLVFTVPKLAMRVPAPPGGAPAVEIEVRVIAEAVLQASDLVIDSVHLSFEKNREGGVWRGAVDVVGPRILLRSTRSTALLKSHKNTIVWLRTR